MIKSLPLWYAVESVRDPREVNLGIYIFVPENVIEDESKSEEGVDHEARPVASEERIFPFPGDHPVILTWPLTSSFAPGDATQIPTLPAVSTTIFWELLVYMRKSCPLSVPIKSVGPISFPESVHTAPESTDIPGVLQVARPETSDTNTFPSPGDQPVIFTLPVISSSAPGSVLPSPILPPVSKKIEFTSPDPPLPKRVRYPSVPPIIPEAYTLISAKVRQSGII